MRITYRRRRPMRYDTRTAPLQHWRAASALTVRCVRVRVCVCVCVAASVRSGGIKRSGAGGCAAELCAGHLPELPHFECAPARNAAILMPALSHRMHGTAHGMCVCVCVCVCV